MSITYPTSLDALSNPSSGDGLNNPSHSAQHANANDAIEALEAKVGVNSSAVTTSHDYKLGEVTGSDKAVGKTATQTLTNKTLTSPIINLSSNATGDTYYRASDGTFSRLPIGATGNILNVGVSGLPEWIANPSGTDASTTQKGIVKLSVAPESASNPIAVGDNDPRLTPFYQQDIALSTNLSSLTTNERFAFGSNQTGTVFYMYFGDEQLTRFEKDTNSGMFVETHTINPTLSIPSTDRGSIIQIGSYIYVFSNNGTNIVCSRFSADDLTGEQAMTVPTVTCTSVVMAWTDGTDAYVVSTSSTTTSRKWSVSGTTFSAVSTASITDIFDSGGHSTFWDGSFAYVVRYNTSTFISIVKLTAIDATTTSTTAKRIPMFLSDGYNGGFSINVNSNLMYVGVIYKNYNENNADAVISYNIRLIPISKP